jgi:hypothetical protein
VRVTPGPEQLLDLYATPAHLTDQVGHLGGRGHYAALARRAAVAAAAGQDGGHQHRQRETAHPAIVLRTILT